MKEENWKIKTREFNFFDLKGILEKLLEELGVKAENILFKKTKIEGLNGNASSALLVNGEVSGYLGEVGMTALNSYGIEGKVFYAEINASKLVAKANLEKRYIPPSRYPAVKRDISVILDRRVPSAAVTAVIREMGRDLVKKVSLADYYEGKQIPPGKRGLLYRIEYRSDEKTLKDREVDTLHSAIKNALSEKLNISFR